MRAAPRDPPATTAKARCPAAGPAGLAAPSDDAVLDSALCTSRGFMGVLSACHGSGGLQCADALAARLEQTYRGDLISLARLIAIGDVLAFDWNRSWWTPMFQFHPTNLSIKPGAQAVQAALGPQFRGWPGASWWARRNPWLGCARPLDRLDGGLAEVLHAARQAR